MKSRSICISIALLASACTGSSTSDDLGLGRDEHSSSQSTVGITGDIEADELPLADAETSSQATGTPGNGNAEASSGSVLLDSDEGTAAGLSSEEGDVTSDNQDRDDDVAVASDVFTACAIVEAGLIAALDGDGNVTDLYTRGAQAAIDSEADSYVALGESLLNSAASDDSSAKADQLLTQCAADGFERLAG